MKRLFTVLLALLAFSLQLFAVKAWPYPVTVTQPDGTTLVIRIHGDENRSWKTTLDGRPVFQDAQGYWRLTDSLPPRGSARLKALEPEGGAISMFLATKAPVNIRTIVIPVQFRDRKFTVPMPRASIYNLFNQQYYSENGATGSVLDWFRDNLGANAGFSFDVCDVVTLPNDLAWYGANDGGVTDRNLKQLVVQACQAADAAVRKHADEFGSRNVRSPYESIRVDKSGIQNKLNAVRGTLAELNTEDYTIRGQQREYADFAEKFHSALAKSIGGALENAIAKHHSTVRINGPGAMHSNESGKLVDFIEERIFNRVQGKFRPAVFLEKAKDAQTTTLPDGTSIRFLDCSALDVDDFVKLAQSYVASVIMSLSSDWQKLNKKMKNGPAPDPVEYMTTREKEREFQLIRNDALARISRLTVDAIRAATVTFGGRYAAACLAAFLNATNGDSPLGVLKPDEAADLVENALSNGVREFYYPPSSNCIKRLKDAAVSAAGGAKMVGSKYRALFGMVAVAYATAPVYARLVAPFEAEEKAMLRREAEYENNPEMQSRIRSIAKAWESNANCARDLAEEYESMISSGRFRDIADFPKIDIKKYKKSNDASRIAAKILRREARLSRIARRLAGIGLEKRIDFLTKGKAAPDGSAKVNPNPIPYAPFVAVRRKRK